MDGCLACELSSGERELPGGRIHATEHLVVEHCIGPLGAGTLIVKPLRHVEHVWELSEAEAAELGPLLARVARAQHELLQPEQIYVTLWSHAGGVPGHIHWVLQPVGAGRPAGLFDRGEIPDAAEVEALTEPLRARLAE